MKRMKDIKAILNFELRNRVGGMDGSAERSTELTPKAHRRQTMC